MAGRHLYSLAADDGEEQEAQVVKTMLDSYGAVKDTVLASSPGKHYPPEYLVYEGLWLHAALTPDQLCMRLPRWAAQHALEGQTNATPEYFDASYRSVALAVDVLMNELPQQLSAHGVMLRRGTVVALLGIPSLHLVLHALALWRLDCSVQYFNHDLGRDVMDNLLANSCHGGTSAILHAGLTKEEMDALALHQDQPRRGSMCVLEVPSRRFAASMLEEVVAHCRADQPRSPLSLAAFEAEHRRDLVRLVTHTSGSTGMPKISRWDLYALGCFLRAPPHIQCGLQYKHFPYLQISRPHWTTSCFLTTYGIASGTAMALCSPANRIYPSTAEALELVAHTQAKSLLLFPAQALELRALVEQQPHRYRPILESLASLQFIGASLDSLSASAVADLELEGKVLILNLHGLGEIGTTSLSAMGPPYNVLYSSSEAALFEPIVSKEAAEDGEATGDSALNASLVKLWIAMDKHPILWYQVTQGRVPSLKVQCFPAAGPMHDRPALDTGDIFEARAMPNGKTGYIHRARDDDIIRLSNLYRPNVTELEARLTAALRRHAANEIDAVQIMGDGKPRLAAVVQFEVDVDIECIQTREAVKTAIQEVDMGLPDAVRIGGLHRVAIVKKLGGIQNSKRRSLLKTHKGNVMRTTNGEIWRDWLDDLIV